MIVDDIQIRKSLTNDEDIIIKYKHYIICALWFNRLSNPNMYALHRWTRSSIVCCVIGVDDI
jgi:hypothetical protein